MDAVTAFHRGYNGHDRITPEQSAEIAARDTLLYWEDATTPRTATPARFVPRVTAPFGLCWGLRNQFAVISRSAVSR